MSGHFEKREVRRHNLKKLAFNFIRDWVVFRGSHVHIFPPISKMNTLLIRKRCLISVKVLKIYHSWAVWSAVHEVCILALQSAVWTATVSDKRFSTMPSVLSLIGRFLDSIIEFLEKPFWFEIELLNLKGQSLAKQLEINCVYSQLSDDCVYFVSSTFYFA